MTKRIIEIDGIKMEIDTRHATRLDTFKIGDKVKLLEKGGVHYQSKVHPAVIVGFEEFSSLPTIVVCYLQISYGDAQLLFAYINESEKSKDQWEIVQCVDDYVSFEKETVLSRIDREIVKREEEIKEFERKRAYFLTHFNKHFERQ